MKLSIVVFAPCLFGLIAAADTPQKSLDERAAVECKNFAIKHALSAANKDYGAGDSVTLEHLDRNMPTGTVIDEDGSEVEGYANIEVTLHRESSDPIVYEMRVLATPLRGTSQIKCEIKETVTRELL